RVGLRHGHLPNHHSRRLADPQAFVNPDCFASDSSRADYALSDRSCRALVLVHSNVSGLESCAGGLLDFCLQAWGEASAERHCRGARSPAAKPFSLGTVFLRRRPERLRLQPQGKGVAMSTNDTFLAIFLGSKTGPRMTAWNALSEEVRR